jgi:hypothetical protein
MSIWILYSSLTVACLITFAHASPQAVGVDGPVGGDSVKTGAGVFEVFAILRR